MKKKQRESIQSMNAKELKKKSDEIRLELEKKVSERYTKPSKNTRITKNLKREIAYIQTLLHKQLLTEANHGA
jgi:ribosomal protein L29